MVAAWIRAETGVGPSMASSSQDCSGNCALLPQAPSSSMIPIAVRHAARGAPYARRRTPRRRTSSRTSTNISMIAIDSPTSPTRLTMKAFLAAVAARRLVVPEADQQVRRETDAFPADVQQQVAVGEDEEQHRRDEQVEVAEEAAPAGVVLPCSRSSRCGSAMPTPVISSTKVIDSGSSSSEASTWKPLTGIQHEQVVVDTAAVTALPMQRDEQHDGRDEGADRHGARRG